MIYCSALASDTVVMTITHMQKINTHTYGITNQITIIWILKTPERLEISNGRNVVSVDWSCIPGRSLEGPSDSHCHGRSACLGPGPGPCHATVAAPDGPLSNAGLPANLGLRPNRDLCGHDGPGT